MEIDGNKVTFTLEDEQLIEVLKITFKLLEEDPDVEFEKWIKSKGASAISYVNNGNKLNRLHYEKDESQKLNDLKFRIERWLNNGYYTVSLIFFSFFKVAKIYDGIGKDDKYVAKRIDIIREFNPDKNNVSLDETFNRNFRLLCSKSTMAYGKVFSLFDVESENGNEVYVEVVDELYDFIMDKRSQYLKRIKNK